MNKAAIHKDRKENWRTPPEIFDPLDEIYQFDWDLAADPSSKKRPLWVGPGSPHGEDLLTFDRRRLKNQRCWINPPYGRNLTPFSHAISDITRAAEVVVALVPASTDTRWFHHLADTGSPLVWFREGRISFIDPDTGKPSKGNTVGSALFVWDKSGFEERYTRNTQVDELGWVTV